MKILKLLTSKKSKGIKSLAILIDPDKVRDANHLNILIATCKTSEVDYVFVGGSLLVSGSLSETIRSIKKISSIPVVLFPGSNLHIDKSADAILFLSLISGRNPELLIGQHVAAAPIIKQANIEYLSTGYILIGSDISTTVAHVSQTFPIPSNKPEIAVCTALAGEMLGMSLSYLDAGSGANEEVPPFLISEVQKSITVPLIVGGGINTIDKARNAYEAGADMLVLGTSIERDLNFLKDVADLRDELNAKRS